jgi:flagellin
MTGSVNTNIGAQIALQNLNVTGSDLAISQKRISTGLRVSDALDNGAVFAIAQGLRSDISAITTVNGQLGAAKGLLSVTNAAATGISNTLSDVRSVLIQLADQNVTGNARVQLNAQFGTLAQSIFNYVEGANYNGVNLLRPNVGSGLNDVSKVIQDTSANQFVLSLDGTPSPNSNYGGSLWTITSTDANGYLTGIAPAAPANATAAATVLTGGSFDTDVNYYASALNSIAAQTKFLDNQITFNNALSDATTVGLGSLVDADLAKESARLQSLQIKQQLGTQSLGIANQTPQGLLALFR